MKRIFTLFICFFTCFAAFFSASCAKTKDYFDYVSEYRQNVLLAANGDNLLKIYASNKEYPYKADGIKRPTSTVCEFFFYAPSGENNYVLSFHYDGKTHGGDLSYDSVKKYYYYSCSLDLSQCKSLSVDVFAGEQKQTYNAATVLTESTLSAKNVLSSLANKESELFSSLLQKGEFLGEIYLRVLYEERVYYYVGIISQTGKITAFLVDGETGNVIAKRQN